MSNIAHTHIRPMTGMTCIRESCINPENGNLKETDFIMRESLDKTCRHCRRRAENDRNRKKGLSKQREIKPKPSFWQEFAGAKWDCQAANDLIKRPWI